MELKTVDTHHVPVRYFEGGSGQPLVFLHGAGGAVAEDPFLAKLAERFHVFAPLLPGYGDSEECPTLRDMLDFTLHGWDVVAALGLKDPILVGHSFGGLVVQVLLDRGLGACGVAIDPAPPKGVVVFEPSAFRSLASVLATWAAGARWSAGRMPASGTRSSTRCPRPTHAPHTTPS